MKSSQNLPEKLKEYRKKNHYSQEQVAEHMNLSRQAISNWETGKAYPDLDNLVMLSELYGTPVDVLLGEEISVKEKTDYKMGTLPANYLHVLEVIGLIAILVLAASFPFCSIPVSLIIMFWVKKSRKNYIVIYIICVICIAIGIQEFVSLYMHINFVQGESFYIPTN